MDLYLNSINIGALWFGIGKTEELTYHGLDFVTMIAIGKVSEDKFRKDMYKSKRKPLEEIWRGEKYTDIANIVIIPRLPGFFYRYTISPSGSSCTIQGWVLQELGACSQ